MDLGSLFRPKRKVWVSTAADAMASMPESIVGKIREVNRPRAKTSSPLLVYGRGLTFSRSGSGDHFQRSEYDLSEIARARDTESYVRLSFDQLKTRIFREPWHLKSRNDKTVAYILTRLREAEMASNISFNSVLRQIGINLVQYSNAFLVKVRDSEYSSGKFVRRYGRDLAPVAAFFSADPTSMEAKRDELGNILQWRQNIPGFDERRFRKENVIHIAYDRSDGFLFGTPWIIPVLDDIRALRRLEELVELLVGKHIFPLYHYKVGTENAPAQEYDDGSSEVDIVRGAVESMPTDGCIVTSERHTIQAISADPIEAKAYLEYFESRVHTGLRISNVDSGRGDTSNRATAGYLSAAKDDLAKDMQEVISDYLTFYLFDELLEEGGFPLNEDNRVYLCWPPIDPEEQRKREAHSALLFQNNLLSETEARFSLNRQPITETQREEMFYSLYTVPQIELKAEIAEEQSALKNVNKPTNQHGSKPTASRPKNDSLEDMDLVSEDYMYTSLDLTSTFEFAMGHVISSILDYEGENALDFSIGDDGLDRQTIMEYRDKFIEADAKLTAAQRRRLKSSTFCGPGRSFPVNDCAHFTAALRLLGRYKGSGNKDRIRSCIMSRGKKLGCGGSEKEK